LCYYLRIYSLTYDHVKVIHYVRIPSLILYGWSTYVSDQDPSVISRDCSDLQTAGITASGVYNINLDPDGAAPELHEVYCDMDTDGGGWTVRCYNNM
jgi:hypothetical protein